MPYSSSRTRIIPVLAVLAAAFVAALSALPHAAHATAITLVSVTATSSNAFTNTGLATTTRVMTGDSVKYLLTLVGATPLTAPKINVLGMGSTSLTGSGLTWVYSTTTTAVWPEAPVTFWLAWGNDAGIATTTITESSLTGTNVTYDKTSPTLSSVVWSDTDSSTQLSGTDTLVLTFSETMATSTIPIGSLDARLGLNNSHTFGTAGAGLTISWNVAGTVLTITLGTDTTAAGADTLDPSTSVKDAVGNIDATAPAVTITDTTAPLAVTFSPESGATFSSTQAVTITSSGSSQIRYSTTVSPASCAGGTLYSGPVTVTNITTLWVLACDESSNTTAGNAFYILSNGGGGGGGGGSITTTATPATPATPASSSAPATPATPAAPAASSSGLSAGQIQSILDVLASFSADAATVASVKASLEGTTVGSATSAGVRAFQSNLTTGSLGSEVKALQQYLNAHGYLVASSGAGSSGNETTRFGAGTRAALAKFQQAHGITPASGYFGAKTRAWVNANP